MSAQFRREDFEPAKVPLLWIVAAVFALTMTHLIAFFGGGAFVIHEARAEASKIVKARQVTPLVNPPASGLFPECGLKGYAEYRWVCKQRMKSAEVTGK